MLGLARNVPFVIGSLTLYLQVHIIRNAAYDILLGRPFDVLTKSVVRNYKNAVQTITLHCPNTDQVTTVPKFERGLPRFVHRLEQQPAEELLGVRVGRMGVLQNCVREGAVYSR